MTIRIALISFIATVGVLCMSYAATGPEYGGFCTPERIANLRTNVEKYSWAKSRQLAAIQSAELWVKMSDEELWAMVPSQDLPRCIDVNMHNGVRIGGCPNCGEIIYETDKYPWQVNVWSKPWKITCPRCKDSFPKNDFGKYYRSGIDETGCFNPKKADRSLLFNEEHPDPNDPKHMWAVDDGFGWNPEPGKYNRFIGYYVWQYWNVVKSGVAVLANAYLFTGDPIYAHKCGVLLDRIADVYPAMDWSVYGQAGWFHSGSTDGGKIDGSIWEVSTVIGLARAYDQVKPGLWNQPELYAFLADKGKQYQLPTPKGTYEQLIQNIDTNLIEEFVKAVQSGRKIYGNEGDPQHCVVASAVALNREPKTSEWLDWVFKEGTVGQGALRPGEGDHVPALIVGTIDRDGVGAEGSPGYSLGWGAALGAAADLLADYGKYTRHSIYRDYPQFRQTFTAGWNLGMLATTTPNIGDTGACGSRGGIIAGDPNSIVRGYKYLKDPQLALIAGWAAKGNISGLGRDIYAADPDAIEKDVARLLEQYGKEPPISGRNQHGYGLTSIQFGPRNTGQALWMYYGLNSVAGHKSELSFGYDAYGFTVVPTLGYRELWGTWPKSHEWEDGQLSHNTVMVNEAQQATVRVGHPEFFAQFPDFGGFSVDSREVYPGISQVYNRTMALVQVGDNTSYALDIFRLQGGDDHLLSFHAIPGPVTADGLTLSKQNGGSYAGPDVPFKTSITGPRMGYSWLDNVERDNQPGDSFVLDFQGTPPYWQLQAEDDLHVRYHCMTRYDDVALADGYPPAGQATGSPHQLRFLLAHRKGTDLSTTNVAVVEPFLKQPLIKRVTRLTVRNQAPGLEAVALKVELVDGAIDYLTAAPDDNTVYQTDEGLTFSGRLQGLRVRNGQVEKAWIIRGSKLVWKDFSLGLPAAGYRGTVAKMDREMKTPSCVYTTTPLPLDDALKGCEIIISNDRKLNACYTIDKVTKEGDLYKIDCGDVCFIRGFVDNMDYSKGYVYNFDEGAEWIIPNRARIVRQGEHVVSLNASAPLEVSIAAPK